MEHNITEYRRAEVAGHKLTPKQWDAFEASLAVNSQRDIAEQSGVHRSTIGAWQKTEWWCELRKDHVEKARNFLEAKIMARVEEAEVALFSIINGDNTNDKTANARVAAIRAVLEMGENPIIQKKAGVQVNTQINNIAPSADIAKKLNELSTEEMIKFNTQGIIPDKIKG